MLEREVTKEDRPVLFELLGYWNKHVPIECRRADLLGWFVKFDRQTIERGIEVTGKWFARKKSNNEEVNTRDLARYATATMRNIAVADAKADEIFGDGGPL